MVAVFPDVKTHWAQSFIQELRSRRIVSGFRDGSFRPDKVMTRTEYAAILQPSFRLPVVREYVPFVDFSPHYWGAGAIQRAYEVGFLSGFPRQRFRPRDAVTRVQVLVSLVNGLGLKTALGTLPDVDLGDRYSDADKVPNYAQEAIAVASVAGLVVNYPNPRQLNPNRGATRGEVAAFIYQALLFLGQVPVLDSDFIVIVPTQGLLRQGTKIAFNGQTRSRAWGQWRLGASLRTGIRDADLEGGIGVELLSSEDVSQPAIAWFSDSAQNLAARLVGGDRYVEITDWAAAANWNWEADGETLAVTAPKCAVEAIAFQEEEFGAAIAVTLSQPTPWTLRQENRAWIATLDAAAASELLERWQSSPEPEQEPTEDSLERRDEGEIGSSTETPKPPTVEQQGDQIILTGNLPGGFGVKATTQANPNRLLLEVRPDPLVEKAILWRPGLRWQQRYLTLESDRFPVTWLTCDRQAGNVQLRPIWSAPTQMQGTEPLLAMARQWSAIAAINAGFFNRKTRLPLGAIRWRGEWFSGPILNRGAMAWNDTGEIVMNRLTLNETLQTSSGQSFPILFLNSGYYRAGISRYTPSWGPTYTPFLDSEIAIAVENSQVIQHIQGGTAGETAIPIPANGYLLVLRANASAASFLEVGTRAIVESHIAPSNFEPFPHILAAGPLLLKDGASVLDVEAEGFNPYFAKQNAIRSIIGTLADGKVAIATLHNRVGGRGPTLPETVQLAQKLGMVDALNFDGGSSTSLYLSGRLLNRPPSSAARVHNGLGFNLS